MRGVAALAAATLILTTAGCEGDEGAGITGVLVADIDDLMTFGDTVILRAVPDHIDGFDPGRPYLGRRVFSASCPLEHTEIPLDFLMVGDNEAVRGAPPRWLLLAWIGKDENETWPEAGALYGTTTFDFYSTSQRSSWADGVVVELDTSFGEQ